MHVTLMWEITAPEGRWKEINASLRGQLKGYSWVRVLRTCYVVKVSSAEDRGELRKASQELHHVKRRQEA